MWSDSQAAHQAREAVGADARTPTMGVRVLRLDRDGWYLLIQVGSLGEPGWVVAVDPVRELVLSWAVNASGHSHLPEPPDPGGTTEYVWAPSASSPSLLFPLLRHKSPEGQVFIDITGATFGELRDTRG